jgi:hypothetical protein
MKTELRETQIKQTLCSAFPGTGKSYYCHNGNYSHYYPDKWCTDSDSSDFPKDKFPDNYIGHIRDKIKDGYAVIFISSHKEVRDALVENDLEFTLVYPDIALKEEYIQRYKNRGNSDAFIDLISNNWDKWISDCMNQKGCRHIVLKSGQFVSNVM